MTRHEALDHGRQAPERVLFVHDEQQHGGQEVHRLAVAHLRIVQAVREQHVAERLHGLGRGHTEPLQRAKSAVQVLVDLLGNGAGGRSRADEAVVQPWRRAAEVGVVGETTPSRRTAHVCLILGVAHHRSAVRLAARALEGLDVDGPTITRSCEPHTPAPAVLIVRRFVCSLVTLVVLCVCVPLSKICVLIVGILNSTQLTLALWRSAPSAWRRPRATAPPPRR